VIPAAAVVTGDTSPATVDATDAAPATAGVEAAGGMGGGGGGGQMGGGGTPPDGAGSAPQE
ncbi:MAG: hypothetical protein ABW004_01510, partial [Aeromicrobium sp.]